MILAIDGRQPHDGEQAARILRSYRPGEHMELKVVRHGKTLTLAATLPEPGSMQQEYGPLRAPPALPAAPVSPAYPASPAHPPARPPADDAI